MADGDTLRQRAGHEAFVANVLRGDTYSIDITATDETAMSASWVAEDVGRLVIAPGVPAGTTVASVTPGVSAELSAAANYTGTVSAVLEPLEPAAGDVWLRSFDNPEGGVDTFGVLLIRNAGNDAWDGPTIANVDVNGNILSLTAEGSTGVLALYLRRPDASYAAQIHMDATNGLQVYVTDDQMTGIDLKASAADGSPSAEVLITATGNVAVICDGVFTYNGTEVAVVP